MDFLFACGYFGYLCDNSGMYFKLRHGFINVLFTHHLKEHGGQFISTKTRGLIFKKMESTSPKSKIYYSIDYPRIETNTVHLKQKCHPKKESSCQNTHEGLHVCSQVRAICMVFFKIWQTN